MSKEYAQNLSIKDIYYFSENNHWYLDGSILQRISCGKGEDCSIVLLQCRRPIGQIEDKICLTACSFNHPEWKMPPEEMLIALGIKKDTSPATHAEDSNYGPFCNCGGPGRESFMLSGEKFVICTVCREEKKVERLVSDCCWCPGDGEREDERGK
jgi:hypothetical protein